MPFGLFLYIEFFFKRNLFAFRLMFVNTIGEKIMVPSK